MLMPLTSTGLDPRLLNLPCVPCTLLPAAAAPPASPCCCSHGKPYANTAARSLPFSPNRLKPHGSWLYPDQRGALKRHDQGSSRMGLNHHHLVPQNPDQSDT